MIYFCGKPMREKDGETVREREHAAARELLLFGLRQEYGIDKMPEIDVEEGGKPFFTDRPDICFNYSHCREGILCGLSRRRIGVDIETVREYRENLAKKICHANEFSYVKEAKDPAQALIRVWVLKEAYIKYTGDGLRMELEDLDFGLAARTGEEEREDCFLKVIDFGPYLVSVCSEEYWDGKIIKQKEYL